MFIKYWIDKLVSAKKLRQITREKEYRRKYELSIAVKNLIEGIIAPKLEAKRIIDINIERYMYINVEITPFNKEIAQFLPLEVEKELRNQLKPCGYKVFHFLGYMYRISW